MTIPVSQYEKMWNFCNIFIKTSSEGYALLFFSPVFKTGLQFTLEFEKWQPTSYKSNWQKTVLDKELHYLSQKKFKRERPGFLTGDCEILAKTLKNVSPQILILNSVHVVTYEEVLFHIFL